MCIFATEYSKPLLHYVPLHTQELMSIHDDCPAYYSVIQIGVLNRIILNRWIGRRGGGAHSYPGTITKSNVHT